MTVKPAGTVTGCSVRSEVPTFLTVNVLLTGEPVVVVPKETLPDPSVIDSRSSRTLISGPTEGLLVLSMRTASAMTYPSPALVNCTVSVPLLVRNGPARFCQETPRSVRSGLPDGVCC